MNESELHLNYRDGLGPRASDFELIAACADDPAAAGELFERHAPAIRGWALRQVGDLHIANDLTAETFAEAFVSASRFDSSGPDASVVGWLHAIAANHFRYWLRRERVRNNARKRLGLHERHYADEFDDIDERLDSRATAPVLGTALRALPREQRLAVWARVVEELSYQETAALLRCSEQAVRQRVSRGLRGLRSRMEGAT